MIDFFDIRNDFVLENEFCLLRVLSKNDYEEFLQFSINEPETWFYSLQGADGKENLKKYLDIAYANFEKKIELPFTIIDKKLNKVAGSTRFYDINFNFNTTQIGYTWLAKEFRQTGLNKSCKYLMLNFAFDYWQMERVELRADARNKTSINAMQSIGAKVDGILRSNMPTKETGGVRRDSIVLSILKNEWYCETKQNLFNKINKS